MLLVLKLATTEVFFAEYPTCAIAHKKGGRNSVPKTFDTSI
ncbi:hypothetical protein [Chlorogloeopsis sp. ULAP02]